MDEKTILCGDCGSAISTTDKVGLDCLVCLACRDRFFAEVYHGAQVDLLDDYGLEGHVGPHGILVVSAFGPTPDDRVVLSGYPHHFREFLGRTSRLVEELAERAREVADVASKRD